MNRATKFSFLLRRALAAGAVASAVGLSAAPAFAQCGPREAVEKRLWEGYKEVVVNRGLGANGMLVEVYAADSGTFTIVLTRPNGVSCVMAVGEGFEAVNDPKTAGLDT